MADLRPENLTLEAPAKINLGLRVVGRRPDGYHLLYSLMVKLDLADRLEIRPGGKGLRLAVKGADLSAGPDNLVWRAAEAFGRAAGLDLGLEMVLEKRVPLAAGLGGGSSDAAAALLGLNRLAARPLPPERLFELGLSLGADVPFFLFPGPAAWAEGVGERLRPGPHLGTLPVLLVNPGWPLSTGDVFKNVKLELTTSRRNHIFSGLNESSFTIDRVLENDLEKVVLPRFPEVALIKECLMKAGAGQALMTGSGPTVFGLFRNSSELKSAGAALAERGKGRWWVRPVHTRPGDPASGN